MKLMTSFLEGLSITGLCVLIVFIVLIVLALFVSILQFVNNIKAPQPVQKEAPVNPTPVTEEPKNVNITDDDMMAAVLVATIDYHDEIKQDVRVVNVKQIG